MDRKKHMKKMLSIIIIIFGITSLCADEEVALSKHDFAVDTSVGFKSEHVFRGRKELCESMVTEAMLKYQTLDKIATYVGINSGLGMEKQAICNHVSPYVGILYDITDMFTLDAGYKYHFYTAMPKEYDVSAGIKIPSGIKRHSNEVYAGIAADVLLKPSLYCFYDFERREVAIEGALGHNFDLSLLLFDGLGIDLEAKVGYDHADKPLGASEKVNIKKAYYCYYGFDADLVYEFNQHAKAKVGIGYEGNSANKNAWVNGHGGCNNNQVWVNASIDCSF
ncbi:MAG: hypothetical protein LBB16_01105 [Puniceicoccales bacterium]|jgi:hypothetical protein|nr:hypothetical protein [Puniceicoccales bacterium]